MINMIEIENYLFRPPKRLFLEFFGNWPCAKGDRGHASSERLQRKG
jgi:hypothetical protein